MAGKMGGPGMTSRWVMCATILCLVAMPSALSNRRVLADSPQYASTLADILALPDPGTILISPLFKSDVSMVETDSSKYGSPTANLLGERRGLVAFKITGARAHPEGGSNLPLLTIEIVDPSEIDLSKVVLSDGGSGSPNRVKLVK